MKQRHFSGLQKRGIPPRRWRPVRWAYAVALIGLLSAGAQASDTLTLSMMVVKGTCTFVLPGQVNLGVAVPAEFTQNGGTVRTQDFSMTLKDCEGPTGGTEKAGIVFSGTTLSGDNTIFSDDVNGDAGFMFKEGAYSGGLSSFKAAAGTVTANEPSQESLFQAGKLPVNGTVVPYTVGFVARAGKTPPVGKVTAAVSFQMSYR